MPIIAKIQVYSDGKKELTPLFGIGIFFLKIDHIYLFLHGIWQDIL